MAGYIVVRTVCWRKPESLAALYEPQLLPQASARISGDLTLGAREALPQQDGGSVVCHYAAMGDEGLVVGGSI